MESETACRYSYIRGLNFISLFFSKVPMCLRYAKKWNIINCLEMNLFQSLIFFFCYYLLSRNLHTDTHTNSIGKKTKIFFSFAFNFKLLCSLLFHEIGIYMYISLDRMRTLKENWKKIFLFVLKLLKLKALKNIRTFSICNIYKWFKIWNWACKAWRLGKIRAWMNLEGEKFIFKGYN